MEFRFTPFNLITLFVMALTAWMVFARFRFRLASKWFLLYYVVVLAYSRAFPHSLNTYWLGVGVASALLLRFASGGSRWWYAVRAAELACLGYVLWRGLGLLLGW
jgi:hypothetical protein